MTEKEQGSKIMMDTEKIGMSDVELGERSDQDLNEDYKNVIENTNKNRDENMNEKLDEMSELERENQRLREENQRLKEYRASLPPKERLYDRIPLTVKQLDIIIAGLVILFLVVCVMGMMHH
ncbi:hypothetical protein [Brotaphodocola sp.]|uniref:hypothetical protein n=1 Tax=Brotaphodocola sp. TaxID=3073577 RepID=UPI003D7EF402